MNFKTLAHHILLGVDIPEGVLAKFTRGWGYLKKMGYKTFKKKIL